jgi:hypothetical protein
MNGGLREDSDFTNAPESHTNNMSYSPHMTPAPAATAPQESAVAVYSQLAAPAKIASTISEQAVGVANGKQEWVISDIIGKEDVDGVLLLRTMECPVGAQI